MRFIVPLFCLMTVACDPGSPAGTTATPSTMPDTSTTSEADTSTTTQNDDTSSEPTCSDANFRGDETRMRVAGATGYVTLLLTDGGGLLDRRLTIEARNDVARAIVAAPGTFIIGLDDGERTYETSSLRVVYQADCGSNGCARTFFATSGYVVVDAVAPDGDGLRGQLVDAGFEEITLTAGHAAPVVGGATAALSCVPFDGHRACVVDEDCPAAAPICLEDELGFSYCGSYDQCPGDDAREPNDDGYQGATPLTIDAPVSGKICMSQDGDGELEVDTFVVDVASRGDYYLFLESEEANFMAVELRDDHHFLMADLDWGFDTGHDVLFEVGRYYLRVHRQTWNEQSVPYTLRLARRR